MIVVVGSRHDEAAKAFVASCPEGALLDADDLSRPEWVLDPCRPRPWLGVAAGMVIDDRTVTGVLVRRPAVFAEELDHIVEGDRRYVASEMTAFLRCWLWLLEVPVFNPPTAVCLGGGGWTLARWRAAAVSAGLTVARQGEGRSRVIVVGGRVVDDSERYVASSVEALAVAAGTPFLSVSVDGEAFLAADPWPDPTRVALRDEAWGGVRPDSRS